MFDPNSVEDIANKLERVLSDDKFRADLIARHLQQARRFSWDESARRAIAAFERFHSARSRTQPPTGGDYRDLIRFVAQVIRKEAFTQSTVLAAATAIAQNYPDSNSEKAPFVDV